MAPPQRDNSKARRRAEQRANSGAEQKQGGPKGGRRAFAESEELEPCGAAAAA